MKYILNDYPRPIGLVVHGAESAWLVKTDEGPIFIDRSIITCCEIERHSGAIYLWRAIGPADGTVTVTPEGLTITEDV